MNADDIIKDLEKNIYCRIAPSLIHGVGVVAIRNIPEGIDPFFGSNTMDDENMVKIPAKDIFSNPKISQEAKDMVKAFYSFDGDIVWFPNCSLNAIDISFFLNHSENPNTRYDDAKGGFLTLRKIEKGEELTSNYRTYSDDERDFMNTGRNA